MPIEVKYGSPGGLIYAGAAAGDAEQRRWHSKYRMQQAMETQRENARYKQAIDLETTRDKRIRELDEARDQRARDIQDQRDEETRLRQYEDDIARGRRVLDPKDAAALKELKIQDRMVREHMEPDQYAQWLPKMRKAQAAIITSAEPPPELPPNEDFEKNTIVMDGVRWSKGRTGWTPHEKKAEKNNPADDINRPSTYAKARGMAISNILKRRAAEKDPASLDSPKPIKEDEITEEIGLLYPQQSQQSSAKGASAMPSNPIIESPDFSAALKGYQAALVGKDDAQVQATQNAWRPLWTAAASGDQDALAKVLAWKGDAAQPEPTMRVGGWPGDQKPATTSPTVVSPDGKYVWNGKEWVPR